MVENIIKDLERLRIHKVSEEPSIYDFGVNEHNAILDGVIEKVRALNTGHTTVTVELDATEAIRKIDRHLLEITERFDAKFTRLFYGGYRRMWE